MKFKILEWIRKKLEILYTMFTSFAERLARHFQQVKREVRFVKLRARKMNIRIKLRHPYVWEILYTIFQFIGLTIVAFFMAWASDPR